MLGDKAFDTVSGPLGLTTLRYGGIRTRHPEDFPEMLSEILWKMDILNSC